LIGKEVEMNWGSIVFKGIVQSDNDFFYDVKITESNTDNITAGTIKSIMLDDITAIK
jgi:hypothetical protein